MSRDKFLLRVLAAIFAVQGFIYLAGTGACVYAGLRYRQTVCADFAGRLQNTFETAVATTLALLGGRHGE